MDASAPTLSDPKQSLMGTQEPRSQVSHCQDLEPVGLFSGNVLHVVFDRDIHASKVRLSKTLGEPDLAQGPQSCKCDPIPEHQHRLQMELLHEAAWSPQNSSKATSA